MLVCGDCGDFFSPLGDRHVRRGRPILRCPVCRGENAATITKLNERRAKQEAMEAYGGQCACCGENELVFLCIDHVNNDGAEHRKEVGSGTSMYRWLRKNKYPSGFQVLCWNCNAAKSILGKCPHLTKR